MLRNLLLPGLLAAMLVTPGAIAQTTPAAPAPQPANPVDPASIQALKDMGAYLQTLKRFQVSTRLTGERVLADGQKLQHSAAADMDVERPNKIRALMRTAHAQRELLYDGAAVTLYTPAQKYYSTIAFSGTLWELSKQLEDRYAVELPLSDLFTWGTPAAPVDTIESAMNAGQDMVGGVLCDHYAFRQGQLDWQVWIASGNKPLPHKIVITNRGDEARPQSVSLITWNLKPTFKNSVFKFAPPNGAKKIEVVQVKNK
jgi:hypothetical protein